MFSFDILRAFGILVWMSCNFKPVEMQDALKLNFNKCSRKLDIFAPTLKSELEKLQTDIIELKFVQQNDNEELKFLIKHVNSTLVKMNKSKAKGQLICDKNLNCISNCFKNAAPSTCHQALTIAGSIGGAMALQLPNSDTSLKPAVCVQCYYQNASSWMLIQRRKDGAENFTLNLKEYKAGFGDINGEYWIGLERLHQITKYGNYELWVLLRDFDGNERNAFYTEFAVASENENYKLTVSGYSGDAGDSLAYFNGKSFSTYHESNDAYLKENCVEILKGGWWYNECYGTLNGPYSERNTKNAIIWETWHGNQESLKYVHMAIRPAIGNVHKKPKQDIIENYN